MAFQPTGGIYFPTTPNHGAYIGGTANTVTLLNTSGQKVAMIFRAPATGTLDRFEFQTGTVLAGGTLKLSWQGVSTTTGDPDGVIGQYRTVFVATPDDNIWVTTTSLTSDGTAGGTKRSVTKGEWVAAVIEFNAFTSESINIAGLRYINILDGMYQSYADSFTPSTWTKLTSACAPFLIVYDGNVAYPIPNAGFTNGLVFTQSINLNTTPDEVGSLLTVPFTCKVDGLYGAFDYDGDCDVILYSSSDTLLGSVSYDSNIRNGVLASPTISPLATELTLTPGTYRVVVKPTTTINVVVPSFTVAQEWHKKQFASFEYTSWTQRTDGGAWTNTVTKIPYFGIRISALSDTSTSGGSGGGISKARLLGGM